MQNKPIQGDFAQDGLYLAKPETSAADSNGQLGRRTFMKRLGLGGIVLLPATTWAASRTSAKAAGFRGGLTDPGGFFIQLIANTAGFHFARIEQAGLSLYNSLLSEATSP